MRSSPRGVLCGSANAATERQQAQQHNQEAKYEQALHDEGLLASRAWILTIGMAGDISVQACPPCFPSRMVSACDYLGSSYEPVTRMQN